MYSLKKGIHIEYPDEVLSRFGDVCLKRKQAKHIIEQRKAEGKSIEEIQKIFDRVPEVITSFDFEMLNPNQKYPGSILRVKFFRGRREGIVVVVGQEMEGLRSVITAHQCRLIYAYLLLLKKLNTSAAGKTPGS